MSGKPSQSDAAQAAAVEPSFNEELDPANQSLADALRKSFGILKLLMIVLVILYFFSGWFSVKPDEVGVVLRFGRILGTGEGEQTRPTVLKEGWHWSWPYPFERWETVSTKERLHKTEFMFKLSEKEQAAGISGYKSNNLSPLRDDYLITGDVNIIHASLAVRYKIDDVVAYLTNVMPAPSPKPASGAVDFHEYPEDTLMSNLLRDATIEVAARRVALDIRGPGQAEFLSAVSERLAEKLNALAAAGVPTGIRIDSNKGVLARKSGMVEGIMPPRQVQEVFDRVDAAKAEMFAELTKAESAAQALLLETVGVNYDAIARAIREEYDLMLALSAAESTAGGGDEAETQRLRDALGKQRVATQGLMSEATGEVQEILKGAETGKSEIIKEAQGDYKHFTKVYPEFLENPEIFMSRMLQEVYARVLRNDGVAKIFVPPEAREYRLHIPRAPMSMADLARKNKKKVDDEMTKRLYGAPKPRARR
ncbi:MAG: SPFH domain-containing protein [Planctomycetota bacterium]